MKDSEAVSYIDKDKGRTFVYSLTDKNAKARLLKGAKRIPFEIVKNSVSWNLVFNIGSWNNVVLPSVRYWNEVQGFRTCRIGSTIIRAASVKTGLDATGKHVDTQIVFFVNREKAVCHFYNTTQLILVNGHGHKKLVEDFLAPYFESKISLNLEEINQYNEQALQTLGGRTVKRGSVKYKGVSTFPCHRCDFAARTVATLAKHNRNEHALSFMSNSTSSSLVRPRHSTRNNSFTEPILQDNMTISNLSVNGELRMIEPEKLKYTCLECDYRTKAKSSMDKHVASVHANTMKDIHFVCGKCNHEFFEEEDYNLHIKTHDETTPRARQPIEEGVLNENLLVDDSVGGKIPSLEEVAVEPSLFLPKETVKIFKCDVCVSEFVGLSDLNIHKEVVHTTPTMTVVVGSNPEETNKNKKEESFENIEENSKNVNSVNEDSPQCEVLDVGLDTLFLM